MVVTELSDLGMYRDVLHGTQALTEVWLTGGRDFPPGDRVCVAPLPLRLLALALRELPPHLLRGALGYCDDLAVNVEVARSGASLQRPALALLQTDRVKVVISEGKNIVINLLSLSSLQSDLSWNSLEYPVVSRCRGRLRLLPATQ